MLVMLLICYVFAFRWSLRLCDERNECARYTAFSDLVLIIMNLISFHLLTLIHAQILMDQGYFVDTANDGQEACDKLAITPCSYDLVLMDYIMPIMDGITA